MDLNLAAPSLASTCERFLEWRLEPPEGVDAQAHLRDGVERARAVIDGAQARDLPFKALDDFYRDAERLLGLVEMADKDPRERLEQWLKSPAARAPEPIEGRFQHPLDEDELKARWLRRFVEEQALARAECQRAGARLRPLWERAREQMQSLRAEMEARARASADGPKGGVASPIKREWLESAKALALLRALAKAHPGRLGYKTLTSEASSFESVSEPTTRRYVSKFVEQGLVSQDPRTGSKVKDEWIEELRKALSSASQG